MKWRGISTPMRVVSASLLVLVVVGIGCSSVTQIDDGKLDEFETLTVHYVDPGPTPNPCDDLLPALDGSAQDLEWNSSEPLLVRMTGQNGSGGGDFFLEVRAVWTDESRFTGGTDRIYLMVRFQDNDNDFRPDILAYGTPGFTGLIESGPIPIFNNSTQSCDPVLLDANRWMHFNAGGVEDQILFLLAEDDATNPVDLIDANRRIIGTIGPEAVAGTSIPEASNIDAWIWRAGRTNLVPVPQYASWETYTPNDPNILPSEVDVPELLFSRFTQNSGFCEDLFFDGSGSLVRDGTRHVFFKNFTDRDPIPDRITQELPKGRGGSNDGLVINGGIANDLALWWPSARTFSLCDTIATSRVSSVRRKWGTGSGLPSWSEREHGIPSGTYDITLGWGMQTPTGSARDVRARGGFEELVDKGFPVRTLEVMREMNTGNSDDIQIVPGRVYRMAIGVLDASGRKGSGSTEIRLVFEAAKPTGQFFNRCS